MAPGFYLQSKPSGRRRRPRLSLWRACAFVAPVQLSPTARLVLRLSCTVSPGRQNATRPGVALRRCGVAVWRRFLMYSVATSRRGGCCSRHVLCQPPRVAACPVVTGMWLPGTQGTRATAWRCGAATRGRRGMAHAATGATVAMPRCTSRWAVLVCRHGCRRGGRSCSVARQVFAWRWGRAVGESPVFSLVVNWFISFVG